MLLLIVLFVFGITNYYLSNKNININNRNILMKGNGSLLAENYSSNFIPIQFSLKGVYPNPFNAKTTLSIQTYTEINPNIQIFDIKGNLLKEQKFFQLNLL